MKATRRTFLAAGVQAAGLLAVNGAAPEAKSTIACQQYPWFTLYQREGRAFNPFSDELLASAVQAGFRGWEPICEDAAGVARLAPMLKKHELEMRSIYVNSLLHEHSAAQKSIAAVLEIARRARDLGTEIVVTNPAPIAWGGAADKNDEQLKAQAGALDLLGAKLRELGLALAYHNHDAELRHGAREFHHMLTATDPTNVKFCFDAHWIFRGCGNSEVAVFDSLSHYADRVVEVHLRQSKQGTWTEAFELEGDISYGRLLRELSGKKNLHPVHLVLEQAVEARTPQTMSAQEAHAASLKNLKLFRP